MIPLRRFVSLITPTLAWLACAESPVGTPSDTPWHRTSPSFAKTAVVVCDTTSEDLGREFDLVQGTCPTAGFSDLHMTHQYEYSPTFQQGFGKHVSATYEYRLLSNGQWGARFVDAELYDPGTRVRSDPFDMFFIEGLAASKIRSYVGPCADPGATNADACWQDLLNAASDNHDEAKYCIDNTLNPVFDDAADVCQHSETGPATAGFNTLPNAVADVSVVETTRRSQTWRFRATRSFDPDVESLGYAWTLSDGYTTTQASFTRTFTSSGTRWARLRVQDPRGGVDAQQQSFAVTLGSPPPPPSAIIGGPGHVRANITCSWVSAVVDGVAPFTYEWRRNNRRVVNGTQDTYTGDTGTSSFTLAVSVTDALGRTDTSSVLNVIVSNQGLPVCLDP